MYDINYHQKNRFSILLALILLLTLMITGCANTEVNDQSATAENTSITPEAIDNPVDPYENVNRKIYSFNNHVDTYVAKPISDAYLWITPQLVQTGIANFFSNLKDINVVLNDAMQGKLQQSAEDSGRFFVNTTAGLGGLFDVASKIGLEKHDEDFAQTLAVWGVPKGPYLVLPLLGPATSRGVPGSIFDTAANPTSYVGLPVQLLSMLNTRANAEGSIKFINEAALDPYVFTRESYLQYRQYLASDGKSESTDDLLDLEDAFYENDNPRSEEPKNSTEQGKAGNEKEMQTPKKGYHLKLTAETDSEPSDFNQASGSFDKALKSFNDASASYQQASDKLDRLEEK